MAAGDINAAQLVILEYEELVGSAVYEFYLIKIKAKGTSEVEAGGGVFEVDE